jgi:hypothetical protein
MPSLRPAAQTIIPPPPQPQGDAPDVGVVDWGDIGGTMADQIDLGDALALKANADHQHDAEYAALSHSHAISGVTGLQAALDAKQAALGFTAVPDTRTVAGKALSGNVTLVKGDVGLGNVDNTADSAKPISTATQTALDGKATTGHNHAGVYEPAGTVATHAAAADPHTGYQLESERAQANGYASLGADGKVPAAQLPAAGSDPWTYVRLAADFTTSSATAVDITGLGFAPAANQRYEFEAQLLLRTATATVNPRAGLAWATGLTDGIGSIQEAQSATAILTANGNINAALLIAVGGLPNTTQSWPCSLWGTALAGAGPSGSIRAQLASETAGTNVTAKAGSFLKYRTVP